MLSSLELDKWCLVLNMLCVWSSALDVLQLLRHSCNAYSLNTALLIFPILLAYDEEQKQMETGNWKASFTSLKETATVLKCFVVFHQSLQAVLFLFVSYFCSPFHYIIHLCTASVLSIASEWKSRAGGPRFESRFLNRPTSLRYSSFSLVPQTDKGMAPQIRAHSPFSHIFNSLSSYHQTLCNTSCWHDRIVQ
jgi:hypothetical protein